MKHAAPLLCLALPFLAIPLHAQENFRGIPNAVPEERLRQGLRDFQSYDLNQAFRRWFADSPLGQDEAGLSKARGEMEKIVAGYGRIQESEVLESRELGERVRRYYFILHCERGPIYGAADAFLSGRGWILTDFQFHTRAERVYPAALLEP